MNMLSPEAGRIDPCSVPHFVLSSGAKIPSIGLGTFGSDSVSAETVARTVRNAIAAGYRQIDCASVYGNEQEIGGVLKEILRVGDVKRNDLWITSKVWNNMHDNVIESCKQSLTDLKWTIWICTWCIGRFPISTRPNAMLPAEAPTPNRISMKTICVHGDKWNGLSSWVLSVISEPQI